MNTRLQRVPPGAVALASAIVLGLLLLGSLLYVVNKHRWATQRLDEVNPRYARLAGLSKAQGDIVALADKGAAELARLTYAPAQDASQVGNDALQRVRELFSGAGLQVISSQVLPPRDDVPGFDRVMLSLRVEGTLAAMQQALARLSTQAPALVAGNVNLQVNPNMRTGAASPVMAIVVIDTLRRRE